MASAREPKTLNGMLPNNPTPISFTEQKIDAGGNCGFDCIQKALGNELKLDSVKAVRKDVRDVLLDAKEDDRKKLIQNVAEHLEECKRLYDDYPSQGNPSDKIKELYAAFTKLRNEQTSLEKKLRDLTDLVNALREDENKTEETTRLLTQLESEQALSLTALEEATKKITTFLISDDIYTTYCNALGDTFQLGIQSALLYAKLKGFSLDIWRRKRDNPDTLEIPEGYSYHHSQNPERAMHMFHTSVSGNPKDTHLTHFNLLRAQPSPELKQEVKQNVHAMPTAAPVTITSQPTDPLFYVKKILWDISQLKEDKQAESFDEWANKNYKNVPDQHQAIIPFLKAAYEFQTTRRFTPLSQDIRDNPILKQLQGDDGPVKVFVAQILKADMEQELQDGTKKEQEDKPKTTNPKPKPSSRPAASYTSLADQSNQNNRRNFEIKKTEDSLGKLLDEIKKRNKQARKALELCELLEPSDETKSLIDELKNQLVNLRDNVAAKYQEQKMIVMEIKNNAETRTEIDNIFTDIQELKNTQQNIKSLDDPIKKIQSDISRIEKSILDLQKKQAEEAGKIAQEAEKQAREQQKIKRQNESKKNRREKLLDKRNNLLNELLFLNISLNQTVENQLDKHKSVATLLDEAKNTNLHAAAKLDELNEKLQEQIRFFKSIQDRNNPNFGRLNKVTEDKIDNADESMIHQHIKTLTEIKYDFEKALQDFDRCGRAIDTIQSQAENFLDNHKQLLERRDQLLRSLHNAFEAPDDDLKKAIIKREEEIGAVKSKIATESKLNPEETKPLEAKITAIESEHKNSNPTHEKLRAQVRGIFSNHTTHDDKMQSQIAELEDIQKKLKQLDRDFARALHEVDICVTMLTEARKQKIDTLHDRLAEEENKIGDEKKPDEGSLWDKLEKQNARNNEVKKFIEDNPSPENKPLAGKMETQEDEYKTLHSRCQDIEANLDQIRQNTQNRDQISVAEIKAYSTELSQQQRLRQELETNLISHQQAVEEIDTEAQKLNQAREKLKNEYVQLKNNVKQHIDQLENSMLPITRSELKEIKENEEKLEDLRKIKENDQKQNYSHLDQVISDRSNRLEEQKQNLERMILESTDPDFKTVHDRLLEIKEILKENGAPGNPHVDTLLKKLDEQTRLLIALSARYQETAARYKTYAALLDNSHDMDTIKTKINELHAMENELHVLEVRLEKIKKSVKAIEQQKDNLEYEPKDIPDIEERANNLYEHLEKLLDEIFRSEEKNDQQINTLVVNQSDALKRLSEIREHAKKAIDNLNNRYIIKTTNSAAKKRLVILRNNFEMLLKLTDRKIQALQHQDPDQRPQQAHLRTAYEYKKLEGQDLATWRKEIKPSPDPALASTAKGLHSVDMPTDKEVIYVHNSKGEIAQESVGYKRYYQNNGETHFQIGIEKLASNTTAGTVSSNNIVRHDTLLHIILRNGIQINNVDLDQNQRKTLHTQLYQELPRNFNESDIRSFLLKHVEYTCAGNGAPPISTQADQICNQFRKTSDNLWNTRQHDYLMEAKHFLDEAIAATRALGQNDIYIHQLNDANLLRAIDKILKVESKKLKELGIRVHIPDKIRKRLGVNKPEFFTGFFKNPFAPAPSQENYRLDISKDRVKQAAEMAKSLDPSRSAHEMLADYRGNRRGG
jgi:chromosome segregation ATPase